MMTNERAIELAAIFHTEYGRWNFYGKKVLRTSDEYGLEEEVMAVTPSVDVASKLYSEMADIAATKAVINALTPEERAKQGGHRGGRQSIPCGTLKAAFLK